MQFAQLVDRVEPEASAGGPVDLSPLTGTWINSNPATTGIARLLMTETGDGLSIRVLAIGPDNLIDWGEAAAAVFAASPRSRTGAGFTCSFEFGFARTRLQGMLAKGLLVLAQIHTFADGSGRADYFLREYFALTHGRC